MNKVDFYYLSYQGETEHFTPIESCFFFYFKPIPTLSSPSLLLLYPTFNRFGHGSVLSKDDRPGLNSPRGSHVPLVDLCPLFDGWARGGIQGRMSLTTPGLTLSPCFFPQKRWHYVPLISPVSYRSNDTSFVFLPFFFTKKMECVFRP